MHVRIVFNGQRHCYSLRNAKATEPAWVGGLRLAWRRRLQQRKPLPPAAHAAAARLLEPRGLALMARHERRSSTPGSSMTCSMSSPPRAQELNKAVTAVAHTKYHA